MFISIVKSTGSVVLDFELVLGRSWKGTLKAY